ncbi:hypothetical protein Poli38472_010235 [Pythium oligandrum]|uniref:EGF-like domain-containing protein n=1 Tax=Pythium oligandrum TaxID=41045 RepID=A0A8K1C946_PYTOL|nr:hypothetical protein Poli38472_010235 [Pythium oligandrum]|eukprot:TMW58676.1 hypothetical protein Poli38472_010235 [Pythium oligandrum]
MRTMLFAAWVWVLIAMSVVSASCPNGCSGHGMCDRYTVCRCQDDYMGHDCSMRRCPKGKAWGVVRGVDSAHSLEVCSGRGLCMYETGTCQCQQGFTGNACQFVECPDSCSAHGRCITMQEHAEDSVRSRELYDTDVFRYDSVWDADILRGCRCDAGYYGASCSLKRCPVGDDPLTTEQVDEVQLIQCLTTYPQQVVSLRSDAALMRGTFLLVFGRQYTRPLSYQALATQDSVGTSVANSLLALQGIPAVTVVRNDVNPGQIDWQITFPMTNPRHSALVPKWKVLEVQQFICAADTGTFSLTFGSETIRNIPFNADLYTFKNALARISFTGTLDITFNGAQTVCSTAATYVTMTFSQLWHRDYFGDIPALTFSNRDLKGVVCLFLNGVDGFIDTETKEVVKGIDTCRIIEQQSIVCAATSGNFALAFEDGTKITDIPYTVSAVDLRSGIIAAVPYIVDVDIVYSDDSATACTTTGTTITISFVVVKSTGARGDGDLAEIVADRTNGGNNGLNHISNRLQLAAAFTEVTRGATCVALDQTYTPDPVNQILSTVIQGGGTFTTTFRGLTSGPIPALASTDQVKQALERLPTIQGVNISYSGAQACETPANVMSITFTQNFANLPTVTVDGSQLVPGSNIVAAGGGRAIGSVLSVDGTKESNVCSNRGLCNDFKLGRCYCFLGYTNSNGRGDLGNLLMNRGDCGAPSRIPVSCPGDLACSGHGTCSGSPTYRCTCSKGWQAGDCSERQCPFGTSWFDYPSDNNVAHRRLEECSGVGTCDRSNGQCKCPRPYTGAACDMMLCGGSSSECSDSGQCLTLSDIAPFATVKGERMGYTYGSDPNNPLTWDRTKIRSCLCDPSFFGFDCSRRECPRGDDPSTYDDKIERQLLQCTATGGTFTLTFRDQTTVDLPTTADAATVKAALESLSTLREVAVTFVGGTTACSVTNTLIIIDVLSELGDLPEIRASRLRLRDSINGNGQDGSGTIMVVSGGASLLGQQSVKGTRENAFCSNHGTCDFATGMCDCDDQYGSSNGKGGPGPIGDCGYRFVRPQEAATG